MGRRLDSILGAYKTAKRSCALMMLDLDRFKYVNDTMGHQAGDDLLRQVAERLRNIIGDRGEIGRLGGDEFQVILPDLDDRGKLGELADKVIQIVSQPYPIEGKRAIIGTSVGVAIAPYDGIEKDELVKSADLALYAAKNGGRGQFRFYSSDLKDEEEERRLLLDDLREALAAEQLELHYQPVVRTKDHVVVGLRGADALGASRARLCLAGDLHSRGRGIKPHQPARRMGAAQGLQRRLGVARNRSRRGQRLGGAVQQPELPHRGHQRARRLRASRPTGSSSS
jgi:diguanylate cyclase (GGDEF)-like protein